MLACLRMILAYCGTHVTEPALAAQVSLEEGGLDPEALASLAKRYDLKAEARQLESAAIIDLVEQRQFPIVLVDRSILDDEFSIHAVIPVRFTRHYVHFLDPLRGERRVARRKFNLAHLRVDSWAVAWKKATDDS